MNDRLKRENERNIRAKDFLNENRLDFIDNTVATLKINNLIHRVNKTLSMIQAQKFGSMEVQENQINVADAFDELLEELRAISDFAHAMEHEIAGLDDKFRLPSEKNPRKFITFAQQTAENAEIFKEQFLDYGMDTNFIDILKQKTTALEKALAQSESSVNGSGGHSQKFRNEVSEANQLIESLDPIVKRVYRADLVKLTAWMDASHVERPLRKSDLIISENISK